MKFRLNNTAELEIKNVNQETGLPKFDIEVIESGKVIYTFKDAKVVCNNQHGIVIWTELYMFRLSTKMADFIYSQLEDKKNTGFIYGKTSEYLGNYVD